MIETMTKTLPKLHLVIVIYLFIEISENVRVTHFSIPKIDTDKIDVDFLLISTFSSTGLHKSNASVHWWTCVDPS